MAKKKVGNHPDFLACRWHGTYHWKDLDEAYNFASYFTLIGGFHTKLWPPKVVGVKFRKFGSPGTKWHLSVGPMAKHKKYYKGEGGGFPPSSSRGEFYEFMFARGSSVHQKFSNYALTNLLFGLCRSVWVIDLLVIRPSFISELQHAPLPSKCCEPRNTFQFLLLSLFSPLDLQLSPSSSLGVRHI
jgi:hypothetical protein